MSFIILNISLVLDILSTMQLSMYIKKNPVRFLLVGSSGLEPPTSRLSGVCSNQLSYEPISGGDKESRTLDLLLARQAL